MQGPDGKVAFIAGKGSGLAPGQAKPFAEDAGMQPREQRGRPMPGAR